MKIIFILSSLFLMTMFDISILYAQLAGRTYFVDIESGNDMWNGQAKTYQGGTIGPWQHLPGTVGLPGSNWQVVASDKATATALAGSLVYAGGATATAWHQIHDGDVIYVKGGTINKVQVVVSAKDWYLGNAIFDSIKIIGGQYATPAWGEGKPIFEEEFQRNFGFFIGAGAVTKGVTLDGFEIRNIEGNAVGAYFDPRAGSATIDIGGVYGPSYITVRRCYLHDAIRNADDRGHGIEGGGGDHFIFEYNSIGPNIGTKSIEPDAMSYGIISNNYISSGGDHGISLTRASHFDVYDNVVNFLPPQREPGYGISISGASYCDIWNNLIYRSIPPTKTSVMWPDGELHFYYASMGIGMYTNDVGMRIVNNTVALFGDFNNAGGSTMMRMGHGTSTTAYWNDGTIIQNNLFYKGYNAAGNIQYAVNTATTRNEDVEYNNFYNSSLTENVMAFEDLNSKWHYSNSIF